MSSRKSRLIVVALSIILPLVGQLETLAAQLLVIIIARTVLFLNTGEGARRALGSHGA
jgi:hypothetical protein